MPFVALYWANAVSMVWAQLASLVGPGDAAGPVRGIGGVGALIARRDGTVVAGPANAVGEAVGEPAVGAGGRHVLEDLAERVLLPGGVGDVRLVPTGAVAHPAAGQVGRGLRFAGIALMGEPALLLVDVAPVARPLVVDDVIVRAVPGAELVVQDA